MTTLANGSNKPMLNQNELSYKRENVFTSYGTKIEIVVLPEA